MKLTGLTVSDYMTPNPLTVEPGDSLIHALETMRVRESAACRWRWPASW